MVTLTKLKHRISNNIKDILNLYSYNRIEDKDELFELIHILFDNIFEIDEIDNLVSILSNNIRLYNHCIDTAIFAALLCIKSGMHINTTEGTVIGALLHDIGLLEIYDKYPELMKTSKYTKEEFEIYDRHTIIGYELIKNIDSIPPLSKKIVLLHHVWNDYKSSYDVNIKKYLSYPKTYDGAEITKDYKLTPVQLVQISSSFHNMVETDKFTRKQALTVIEKNTIIQYGQATKLFLNYISPYSIGEKVILNLGLMARVISHSFIPDRPIVELGVGNTIIDLTEERAIFIAKTL